MLNVGRILLSSVHHVKPGPGVVLEGGCEEMVAHLAVIIYNLLPMIRKNSPFFYTSSYTIWSISLALHLVSIITVMNGGETGTVLSSNLAPKGHNEGESDSWEWWRNWDLLSLQTILALRQGAKMESLSSFSLEVQSQKGRGQKNNKDLEPFKKRKKKRAV